MKNLILASNNAHKVKEIKQILTDYNILTLKEVNFTEDIIEDGDSFEENALIKARTIAKYSGKAAIADDSGLSVDKLNGRPGVYSARYSPEQTDEKNIEKLLENLSDIEKNDRKAHFVSVVSIAFPDGTVKSFRGETQGEILFEKEGNNGFGYDPVFYSYDLEKSLGVATIEEKKSVSHRGRAFEKLKKEVLEKL